MAGACCAAHRRALHQDRVSLCGENLAGREVRDDAERKRKVARLRLRLDERLQRRLPGAARQQFVSHLADCDDCRKIATQLAMAAGAAAYVAKPNIEGLISTVHELLAGNECTTTAD